MPRTDLPSQQPPGPHSADGKILNRINRSVNAITQDRGGASVGGREFRGHFHSTDPPAMLIRGVAVVTDASDDCPDDPDLEGEKAAPCASLGLYLAKFRVFDWSGNQFIDFDEAVPLNAGTSWETANSLASNSSGYPHGPVRLLKRGDAVPVYWDSQASALVPLATPPREETAIEISHVNDGTNGLILTGETNADTTVIVAMEVDDGSGWRTLPGRDLALDLSNKTTDAVSGMMWVTFRAKHGTKVRLVAGAGRIAANIDQWGLTLWAVARSTLTTSSPTIEEHSGFRHLGTMSLLRLGRRSSKDQPTFVNGVDHVRIDMDDPEERWDINGEFFSQVDGNSVGVGVPGGTTCPVCSIHPATIDLTIPEGVITNVSCDVCTDIQGTFELTFFLAGAFQACSWVYDLNSTCADSGVIRLSVHIERLDDGTWRLAVRVTDTSVATGGGFGPAVAIEWSRSFDPESESCCLDETMAGGRNVFNELFGTPGNCDVDADGQITLAGQGCAAV